MYENEKNTTTYFDYTDIPVQKETVTESEENQEPVKAKKVKTKKEKIKKEKSEKKPGFFKRAVVSVSLGLLFGAFAGLGFYGISKGADYFFGEENPQQEKNDVQLNDNVASTLLPFDTVPGVTKQITYVQDDITEMVEEVMPAMVSIVNTYTYRVADFWGQTRTQTGMASGSGIIVGKTYDELLIATNNHVVEDATKLEVSFIDGKTGEAIIKGTDPDMDLAVIAVPLSSLEEGTLSEITVAKMGDSDNLRLGMPVVAIGNALGYGQSVTNGIVSALNREVKTEDGNSNTFIQTNAAINPGNSGGALLNIDGEVIGINSNKIGGDTVEGMGYAIPISAAKPILTELMERQTRVKVDEKEVGYMGISMQTVTDSISEMYGMPKGVYVSSVMEGSAAEKAGVHKGDIIVKFDGQRIMTNEDISAQIQYFRAGETVKVTVKRFVDGDYVAKDIEITLGEKPSK